MSCEFLEFPEDQEIEGVSDDLTPFNFPVEGGYALFYFTNETFTKVLSALWNGAILTYPNEAYQVIWYFLKNVEATMPICAQIIDCLTNDADTKQALIDALKTSDEFNQYLNERTGSLTPAQIESNVLTGSCDLSLLAGQVTAIVEKMHLTNVDFLEIVEVGTNDEEKVAALLEGIPVLDELPVGDILEFAQDILEDFSENYAAAITEEWKDGVEFDLWCLAQKKVDCKLSYRDLFDYFQGRVGSGLTIGALIYQVLDFIADGDFNTDDLVASGMYALQLAIILIGRDYAGMNLPRIGALTRDADPSSKWEDWDECPQNWCYEYNLKTTAIPAEITLGIPSDCTAVQTIGTGIVGTTAGNLDRNGFVYNLADSGDPDTWVMVDYAEMEIDMPSDYAACNFWIGYNDSYGSATSFGSPQVILGKDIGAAVYNLWVFIERAGFNTDAIAPIIRFKVRGQGEEPLGPSTC